MKRINLILGVLVFVTSWSVTLRGQEMMNAYRHKGIAIAETSGQIYAVGSDVKFVGRSSGIWRLSPIDNEWILEYSPAIGTLLVLSTIGADTSLLFLDSKRNVWRHNAQGDAVYVTRPSFAGDQYLLQESYKGMLIVGKNRILGRIHSEFLDSTGRHDIRPISPSLREVSLQTLKFSSLCSCFILDITGQVPSSLDRVQQRYMLKDSIWTPIENEQTQPVSMAELRGSGTYLLSDNTLSITKACPPAMPGERIVSLERADAITSLSDSTFALYPVMAQSGGGTQVFIYNSGAGRIVDTLVVDSPNVLFDVIANSDPVIANGDLTFANCTGRVLVFKNGIMAYTINWPTGESTATFSRAAGGKSEVVMFGSAFVGPHVLSLSDGTWHSMFAISGSDTSRISIVDGGCQFGSSSFLWRENTLFVSAGRDTENFYYRTILAPRLIHHVRALSDKQALVLVIPRDYDTISPSWYMYSHDIETLMGYPDNWPRANNILPITESVFDEPTSTIVAGTLTHWYGGRTDTSVYPIYGVLRRSSTGAQWEMANDGLGLSLRCYALKMSKHGVLYMLAGYSESNLINTRPSLYISSDVGLTWTRSTFELPLDLSKAVRLSVTDNGVFVHTSSCYRVSYDGENIGLIEFTVGNVGWIFSIVDGVDSTRMVMLTTTGVYDITTSATTVDAEVSRANNVTINGNIITLWLPEISGTQTVTVANTLGQVVLSESVTFEPLSRNELRLSTELSKGIYFVIVANSRSTVLNLGR